MKRFFLSLGVVLVCVSGWASVPKTVVIDAGHGGWDRGGIPGQFGCEKTLALDVALRLQPLLEEHGVKTVMTRKYDTFIPLSKRVAIANSYPGALLVSVHFNAGFRRGAAGVEVFYHKRHSADVARCVESKLNAMTADESRGVKQRGYYVLKHTRNPAILVECGFLTNPQEAALCRYPAYRQKLAEAIASAIVQKEVTGGIAEKMDESNEQDG